MTIGIDLGKSAPEDYLKYYQKAYTALQEERIKDALLSVEEAKKIYLDDPELMFIEGACLIKFKEYDKASKLTNQLLELNPYHEGALFCKGMLYFEKKQYALASENLSKVKSRNPIFNELPFSLGTCWLQLGEYEKARQCFLKAMELKPKEIHLKSHLIKTDLKLKRKLTIRLIINPFNGDVQRKRNTIIEELHKANNTFYKPPSKLKTAAWVLAVIFTVLVVGICKLIFFAVLEML